MAGKGEPNGTDATSIRDPNSDASDLGRAVRIREALADGGGRVQVAGQIGVHPGSLTRYMAGRDLPTATLVAIADACGVSVEWLATGRGPKNDGSITSGLPGTEPVGAVLEDGTMVATFSSQNVSGSKIGRYVAIPRYNIQASAGFGALAEHAQVVEYFAFDLDFVRTRLRRDPRNLVLIEARGDSMDPTIRDGDILTVDVTPDQPLQSSTLYVIRVEDALLVKRLDRRIDGAIAVHSDNARYPPETVLRGQRDDLHIIGQVILVSTPPR